MRSISLENVLNLYHTRYYYLKSLSNFPNWISSINSKVWPTSDHFRVNQHYILYRPTFEFLVLVLCFVLRFKKCDWDEIFNHIFHSIISFSFQQSCAISLLILSHSFWKAKKNKVFHYYTSFDYFRKKISILIFYLYLFFPVRYDSLVSDKHIVFFVFFTIWFR